MTTELRNKLIAQALLALSQLAFPLIIYPFITDALRAEGLGKVNFADSLVQTALILASLGIPLYGIREISVRRHSQKEQSRAFLELVCLQMAAAIPATAFLWITGWVSGVDQDLLWTGILALLSSCLTAEWFLQGNEQFLFIAFRSFLIRAVTAVCIIVLIQDPGDTVLYYALLTGSVVLTVILNWIFILRRVRLTVLPVHPWRHFRQLNWIYGCYILASLYTVADSLLLGWMADDASVGQYSFAYRLVRMSAMLIPTLGIVFIPRIAFHHENANREEIHKQVSSSQELVYFFCIPMSIFFFIMAPEIISVFANEGFLPSVMVLRILSLLPLLVGISHLAGTQVLVSIRKEKKFFGILAAGLVMNIISNFLLIPRWQETGAAFSNLLTEAVVAVTALIFLHHQGYFRFRYRSFATSIFASLFTWPLAWWLRTTAVSDLQVLLYTALTGGTVYLLVQYFFPAGKSLLRNMKQMKFNNF